MQFAVVVLLMALVQGVCEFLPVSSSGHLLVLGKFFFPHDAPTDDLEQIALSVLLHAGTFLSILVVYRRMLVDMLLRNHRLLAMVVVASIPTGLIGFGIKKYAVSLETSLTVAGMGFLVTGFLLFSVISPGRRGANDSPHNKTAHDNPVGSGETFSQRFSFCDAFFIGLIQGIAVLPGFSRSGLTLAAGMTRGLPRDEAAAFSFLIALPALAGASVVELIHPIVSGQGNITAFFARNAPLFLCAFLISFVIGVISLKLFLRWLQNGKLHYLGFWLLAMAAIALCSVM